QLGSSATILATSGGYTIVSDGRYKEAVQEDIKGLDFILRLRPVTYRFNYEKYEDALRGSSREDDQHYRNSLARKSQERQMGFIAQEVETAVNQSGESFNGLYLPQHAGDNYALDYGRFTVPLVKAIQEQQTQIEQLKAENAQLRQQLDKLQTLEARIQALENQHR
ncbi:MAG: tail fiber domain-containing protein, partial [Thermoanaerobaculia bacterium]|nr:tail fiber domain-containing protein [Thermoanaerobaculia bacterium]